MSAHTPGPWMAIPSVPEEGYECIWLKVQPSPAMRGFTKELGAVNGPINDENLANARLIAAAPVMLEQLEIAAKWISETLIELGGCDHDVGVCSCADDAMLSKIYATIAEAKGEPVPVDPNEPAPESEEAAHG